MEGPVNANIAALQTYKPGRPIEEVARELGFADGGIVKLASNENPRGPAPAVRQRISAAVAGLARYPDGNGYYLKQALAAHHDLEPNRITLGNGSNEVLEIAAKAILEAGSEAIMSAHGFIVQYLAASGCGATLITAPALRYGCDPEAMLARVTERTRLIFIANPNNPTGAWVNEAALVGFLERLPQRIWVLLDEAYFEYAAHPDYPDGRALLDAYPNLIVTRTFSKAHALAGLRIGYGLSSPQMADLMNRARQPFNVNSLALAAAETALRQTDFLAESAALNRAALAMVASGLRQLGLAPLPSLGNFLCVDVKRDARPVFEALLKAGVIVRTVAEYGLAAHIRVSLGLPQENQRFLAALGDVLRAPGGGIPLPRE